MVLPFLRLAKGTGSSKRVLAYFYLCSADARTAMHAQRGRAVVLFSSVLFRNSPHRSQNTATLSCRQVHQVSMEGIDVTEQFLHYRATGELGSGHLYRELGLW